MNVSFFVHYLQFLSKFLFPVSPIDMKSKRGTLDFKTLKVRHYFDFFKAM